MIDFRNSDFYSAHIDYDPQRGTNFLCIDIKDDAFPLDDAALIIGDALHNLRSALDLMYYQIVLACSGTPSDWTKFPVYDTSEKLDPWLSSALKGKQINECVLKLLHDDIKPYKTGNPLIFALHCLNISDKHEFFIPVLKLVGVFDVRLEDDKGRVVGNTGYLMDESCRIRIQDADDRKIAVKNKGHATPQYSLE